MDVFPKWIIEGNDFYIGNVSFHKNLIRNDPEDVIGGGWFHLDKENKILYLYGTSTDFGSCTLEQVRKAKEEARKDLQEYTWRFFSGGDLGACQMMGINI